MYSIDLVSFPEEIDGAKAIIRVREIRSECMSDCLRKRAETPYNACYLLGGVLFKISTNCHSILKAADESLLPIDPCHSARTLRLRVWVDSSAHTSAPWPNVYCRGLGDLVFVGFDSKSSLLVDLSEQRVLGRFSPELANDRAHWKSIVFPVLLSIIAASLDVVELHSACVTQPEGGLLLAGESGSGKSTLAFVLAQSGFAFLSDDRTYVSRNNGRLQAWGLPTSLKLRPDAASLFPQLSTCKLGATLAGERAFYIDPERHFGLTRSLHCEPRWLVFLERNLSSEVKFSELPKPEAKERLRKSLMLEAPEVTERQLRMLDAVTRGKCWLFRYGGDPLTVAGALTRFCRSSAETSRDQNEVRIPL